MLLFVCLFVCQQCLSPKWETPVWHLSRLTQVRDQRHRKIHFDGGVPKGAGQAEVALLGSRVPPPSWIRLGPSWSQVSFLPGNLGQPTFFTACSSVTRCHYTIWKSSDLTWSPPEFPQDCRVPVPGVVFFTCASPSSLSGPQ